MHLTKEKALFLRFSLKTCFVNFRAFFFKKSSKNPSKMKPEHLKKRCQKHVIFGHRLFRVPASILEGLEPPSWKQIGRLGTPGRSQKSPKSNILGTGVQDARKKTLKKSSRSPRLDFWMVFKGFGSLLSLFSCVKVRSFDQTCV